jgi:prepilin signal peptidase PulO-like enzyme (type II secretory pathway)
MELLGDGWIHLLRILFMISILIIIFATDTLYQIIWPEIVWLGAILGFVFNFFIGQDLFQMAIGFAVGGGFFLLQYLISGGKWIGGGDVRMGAMMGIWLGWPVVILAIFLAYVTGAIFGLVLLTMKKKTLSAQIAFGPFLALATLFCLHHGEQILSWYLILLK